MNRSLVIGTRGSALALWQAEWVRDALLRNGSEARLEIVRTEGDARLDVNLSTAGDKGLFTKELETALLEGRIDVAVHSLKDLPTTLPEGLKLGAIPPRGAAGDVLLVRPEAHAPDAEGLPLARGSRVGTASPRRAALLAHVRPDLDSGTLFRGNVPTRVAKCVRGEVDAIVLARAGLERLKLDVSPLLAFNLSPERWLHAPGQGALGLEIREDDAATMDLLAKLNDDETATAVRIERSLLARLEAGCHAALGAWARHDASGWRLIAGALGQDERWHQCESSGRQEDLVERAALSLLGDAPVTATRGLWVSPARVE